MKKINLIAMCINLRLRSNIFIPFIILLMLLNSSFTESQTYPTFVIDDGGSVINVSDYGAYPNDGICDEDQINDAIAAAGDGDVILFEEGVYNLRKPDSRFTTNYTAHILISNKTNITLRGAVDGNGEPATHIKRELVFQDNKTGNLPSIFKARVCNGLKLENLTFTNDQLFSTVGKVISKNSSTVNVEILDGYPVDDGCEATAANVWTWDPATQSEGDEILKIGAPSVTYTSGPTFTKVSGTSREMETNHSSYDNFSHVDVGDYISWHYGFASLGTVYLYSNTNTHLENVHIYSALRSSLFIAYSENVYANNVEIRPENNRFAMSPRDGVHASRNKGEFVFENFYAKGTRLDAFVVTGTAAEVYSKTDARNLEFITDQSIGSFACNIRPLYFNDNGVRHKVDIESVSYISNSSEGSIYEVVTSEDMPSFVELGTNLIPAGVSPDTVIVRNSTFNSIAGSSNILFCDNVLSDNNHHENIMYAALRFGANPSRNHAGSKLAVTNSTFKDCAWEINLDNPDDETMEYGYINAFNANVQGYGDMDVSDIIINNNQFESTAASTGIDEGRAGIILDEARNITITNNSFSGITEHIQLRDVYGDIVIENNGFESGAVYRINNLINDNYLRGYDPNLSNTHGNDSYVTVFEDRPTWSTQKWTITEDPDFDGYYHIQNAYSKRYIRGYDPDTSTGTADGDKVSVYDYKTWATLKWEIIPVEEKEGYYHIKNRYSGNYLKGSASNDSYITQSSVADTTETCWALEKEELKSVFISDEFVEMEKNKIQAQQIYVSLNFAINELEVVGYELEGNTFELYNLVGHKVLSLGLENDKRCSINIGTLSPGIYLTVIRSGADVRYRQKLVVY